jgi:hypothetical protein
MSEAEKSAQIGEFMLLLEQQKRELAHLGEKMDKVAKVYRTFGSEFSRLSVSPTDPNKVFFVNTTSAERDLGSHLLDQYQLAALITEHKNAKDALAQTKAKLTGFGITSV